MARSFIDTKVLRKFIKAVSEDTAQMDPVFNLWAKRYETFTKRRYNKSSRGGGNWKKLAKSTRERRRKARRGRRGDRSFAILKDTGTLFKSLTIGAPGNLKKRIKHGIRYGFSKVKHPGAKKITIQRLAAAHDEGDGVPKRQILVEPDSGTRRRMKDDLKRTLQRIGKRAGG